MKKKQTGQSMHFHAAVVSAHIVQTMWNVMIIALGSPFLGALTAMIAKVMTGKTTQTTGNASAGITRLRTPMQKQREEGSGH